MSLTSPQLSAMYKNTLISYYLDEDAWAPALARLSDIHVYDALSVIRDVIEFSCMTWEVYEYTANEIRHIREDIAAELDYLAQEMFNREQIDRLNADKTPVNWVHRHDYFDDYQPPAWLHV